MRKGRRARVKAQVLANETPGETQGIDNHLATAMALFEQGEARLDTAHTQTIWGKILRRRGDVDAARKLFDQAAAQYRKAGLDALANQAEVSR